MFINTNQKKARIAIFHSEQTSDQGSLLRSCGLFINVSLGIFLEITDHFRL